MSVATPPCKVLALGYANAVRSRVYRDHIRAAHEQLAPPAAGVVCFSYVFGRRPPITREYAADWLAQLKSVDAEAALERSPLGGPRFFWADVADDDAAKVVWWFVTATAASWAPWIGKADDDAFVQPSHVAADLADIQARHGLMGQLGHFMWTVDWRLESDVGVAGHPCGFADTIEIHDDAAYLARVASQNRNGRGVCNDTYRGPRRWLPHGVRRNANATGPYPFSAGPLEIFGIDLARRVFLAPEVLLLCSSQRFSFFGQARSFRGDKNQPDIWGEDPVIGYLAHYAASVQRFSYLLHHLTWTKLHNWHWNALEAPQTWSFASSSAVVHRLKAGRGSYANPDKRTLDLARAHAFLRNATSKFRRCFRPFAFEWNAAEHALTHLDAAGWARYKQTVRLRSIFGMHWEPHCGRTECAPQEAARRLKQLEAVCELSEG
jgi:hypothetical protein